MKKPAKIAIAAIVVLVIVGAFGTSGTSKSSNTSTSNTPAITTTANTAATQKQEANQASKHSEEPVNGIRPEVKSFLDDYETFINEYCDFMEHYDSADAAQFARYGKLMMQYTKLSKECDDMKNDLSDEETAYYLEVLGRTNVRLAQTSAAMQS